MSRLALLVLFISGCAQPYRRENLRITSGDVTLAATIVAPANGTRSPAVVLVHGSGPDDRSNPYYTMLADAFVKRGFAVLIYDKRGSGESNGDWRGVAFGALIDDATAAARSLRHHAWVDSTRVGVWGGSEGAVIAPEVALREPLAFVIMQSAPLVTMAEQNLYQTTLQLRAMTPDSAERAAGMRLQLLKHQVARTGDHWPEYEAALGTAAGTRYADLAQPRARNDWWFAWYRSKMDYTPVPALQRVKAPVLAIWGDADVLVPVERSRAAFAQARGALHVRRDMARVVHGADHTLYINGLRGIFRRGVRNRPVMLNYAARWAADVVADN